jgi:hypothetical protein
MLKPLRTAAGLSRGFRTSSISSRDERGGHRAADIGRASVIE